MSKKQKQKAISAWMEESERRDKVRDTWGIRHIPEEEVDAYTTDLAEAKLKLDKNGF